MNQSAHSFDDQFVIPSLQQQLSLFDMPVEENGVYFNAPDIDLDDYDKIIIAHSGGKDGFVSMLHMLDLGVDRSKLELWHHLVDGNEGSDLMDWIFMDDYMKQIAKAYELPLYRSWLEGGFESELIKENSYSKPHKVETPDGLITLLRDKNRSKPATRRRFPQQSASLQTRWCSSSLKIDVSRRALANQERFDGKKVLFVTGERRQESSNRAKYNQLEPHICDRRKGRKARHVDAWRPVLNWSEEQVWDKLREHGVIAPVPYRLGWGRSSCAACIFNGPKIWSTLAEYFPERTQRIADYEDEFGVTISRKQKNVIEVAKQSRPMEITDMDALQQSMSDKYTLPLFTTSDKWEMPAGAFSNEGCGAV